MRVTATEILSPRVPLPSVVVGSAAIAPASARRVGPGAGRSGEPMLGFAAMTAKPLPERNDPVVERAWRELPDTLVGEILDGVLHVHPRPARTFAAISVARPSNARSSVVGGRHSLQSSQFVRTSRCARTPCT